VTQDGSAERQRALVAAFVRVLAGVAAYVLVWTVMRPGGYLLAIFGTYAALAVALLVQLFRATAMPSWRRRLAAVLTIPAVTGLIFAGLRPRPDCLDLGGCGRGLTLQPTWFLLFFAVTTTLVAVDSAQWRA